MDPQQLLDKYVKAGNVEGVRQLLARSGTSSLDGLVNNRSPLMRAAMGNKPAMVSALLGMGASIGFTNKEGWTALHLAAKHGAVPVVDALVDAGADLEARSNSGRTPLALACRSKQLPAAKKLLDRGANTSTTDKLGCLACNLTLLTPRPSSSARSMRLFQPPASFRQDPTPVHQA